MGRLWILPTVSTAARCSLTTFLARANAVLPIVIRPNFSNSIFKWRLKFGGLRLEKLPSYPRKRIISFHFSPPHVNFADWRFYLSPIGLSREKGSYDLAIVLSGLPSAVMFLNKGALLGLSCKLEVFSTFRVEGEILSCSLLGLWSLGEVSHV